MSYELHEVPISRVAELASVPIAFTVGSVLDVSTTLDGSDRRSFFAEREIAAPYVKDYDSIEGEGPARWAQRFDISSWGSIVAVSGERWVGGVVIAYDTSGVDMLEGRVDLAVVWDLRVHPAERRRGLGTRLFRAAERWAIDRGCSEIKVETQDTNVAACRFYRAMGCVVGSINPFAYAALPDETQVLWRRRLRP